jgi:hypothetical protein
MDCSEAVHKPSDELHSKKKQILKYSYVLDPPFPRIDLKTVWEMIGDYTKRNLAKTDDALNALLGIFSALEKKGEIEYQIRGIPIVKSLDFWSRGQAQHPLPWHDAFAIGLFWEGHPSKRRASFPSWSWAGWSGQVWSRPYWDRNKLSKLSYFKLADAADMWLEQILAGGGTAVINIKQLEKHTREAQNQPKFAPII